MSVKIRRATSEDLPGLFRCLEELSPVGLVPEESLWIFLERQDKSITFVAVEEETVVGTATLELARKYIHKGGLSGRIEEVAVLDSHRHRGIGSLLVQACVDEAQRLGCYKIVLHCKDELEGFYGSLGFTRTGVAMRVDGV